LLFWPAQPAAAAEERDQEEQPPGPSREANGPDANGAYRPKGNGFNREQAA